MYENKKIMIFTCWIAYILLKNIWVDLAYLKKRAFCSSNKVCRGLLPLQTTYLRTANNPNNGKIQEKRVLSCHLLVKEMRSYQSHK